MWAVHCYKISSVSKYSVPSSSRLRLRYHSLVSAIVIIMLLLFVDVYCECIKQNKQKYDVTFGLILVYRVSLINTRVSRDLVATANAPGIQGFVQGIPH